jgi:hypothetical protein
MCNSTLPYLKHEAKLAALSFPLSVDYKVPTVSKRGGLNPQLMHCLPPLNTVLGSVLHHFRRKPQDAVGVA